MILGKFWQEQSDERCRSSELKRLAASFAAHCRVSQGAHHGEGLDLPAAVVAAAAALSRRRSVADLFYGDPNNQLNRALRWAEMLRQASEQGAKRMRFLDAAAPDGVSADIDVELGLLAAQLDVLDLLVPRVRNKQLADQVQAYTQNRALQTMANRTAKGQRP